MNKEGLTNYPRAIIQLINKREIMPVTNEPLSEGITQLLKDGMRFT